jgi:predicted Zn-dependent peptidase
LQADRVSEALADVRAEIQGLLNDRPPTAPEVDDARRALIEGQARHFESPASLVARYGGLFLHGLPTDHHARLPDRLASLGTVEVADAARRIIDPHSLVYVVVADADLITPALEKMDWGPVERRSPSS